MNPPKRFPIFFALATLLASPAFAVIVAGANGGSDNSNNTTAGQLDSYLASGSNVFGESLAGFDIYDNVIPYSDSSGIYLGFNATTHDVWVLSAKHVNDSNSALTIDGLSYTFQQRINLSGDLELNRYLRIDLAVPSLPSVTLASSSPTANAPMILVGLGRNRNEAAATNPNDNDSVSLGSSGLTGYTWSGTKKKRWGTNHVDSLYTGTGPNLLGSFGGSTAFTSDFDRPSPGGWLSSTESIAALNDSGGSAFLWTGSDWVLGGIFSGATVIDIDGNGADPGDGSPFRTVSTWTGSIMTDIATYSPEITGAIGSTLIPEPGLGALLVIGSLVFLFRRTR